MSLSLIAAAFLVFLAIAYRLWGGFVARSYRLDDAAPTPAVRLSDGTDFVPTRRFYLLGQHVSAIAAAGPIAGPILACQAFGWLPCLIWISLGVVFIGAVHDVSALVASVRHQGRSIAEIVRTVMGPRAALLLMAFIWIALVYVIAAFADITASTFIGRGETPLPGGLPFNAGGAVAAASTLYLGLAIAMGLVERFLTPPLWLSTLIFVPATLASVWAGTRLSTWLLLDQRSWSGLILAYCFVAALLPVWILLQPRGYLGGFVLYLALGAGLAGLLFGGFTIQQPAFRGFTTPGPTGSLFPFLFVTIACGACSGFHGLVCSGTTSKQIARESDCRAVGYGGMLIEGVVALIALATVMILAPARSAGAPPGVVYGDGLARFITAIWGEQHLTFAATFGAMAFSTFVFDTIDVGARLGRYILQEMAGATSRTSAVVATALTVGVPWLILYGAPEGAYRLFWTLFGTSNQLLAGLTLLSLSVWLRRSGRRSWITLAPAVFVLTITVWSLILQIGAGAASLRGGERLFAPAPMNAFVATLLLALGVAVAVEAAGALRTPAPLSRAT